MSLTIAVIADTHLAAGPNSRTPKRRCEIAELLLMRAVQRVNRLAKPDVTVFIGDLLDDGESADGPNLRQKARNILAKIVSPLIVLPGNHDKDVEAFYRDLPRPEFITDVAGARFLTFIDPEEPHYCARRVERDIERMAEARAGFDGPIVCLQHVPLFPPGAHPCPHNYTNAGEIIPAMRRLGVTLSISGHYHQGIGLIQSEGIAYVTAPALCESPFAFLELAIDGPRVEVRRHELRMPDSLALSDRHVHSHFAYCNENMDFARALALGRDFGLAGVGFSEHSSHLYFDRQSDRDRVWSEGGIAAARPEHNRIAAYFAEAAQAVYNGAPPNAVGLEVDCDYDGHPVLLPSDRKRAAHIIGAIHRLRELRRPQPDVARACDEFMATLQRFLPTGMGALAHPFRVFRRAKAPIPSHLFEPVARLLREHNVAAEINFHTNEPPPEFVRLCIERGVKLAFGSDAHNLYEIGDFAYHLDLLRRCGYDGDPRDVLTK